MIKYKYRGILFLQIFEKNEMKISNIIKPKLYIFITLNENGASKTNNVCLK